MIHKQELKYILYSVGFALLWFLFILPKFIDGGVESSSPYYQFLLFNVGIFIVLQIFFKSLAMNTKVKVGSAIGLLALFAAIDIMAPPFLVSRAGELLSGPVLSASAADYIAGYLGISLGLQGIWIYLFTYVAVPFSLMYVAARLLPNFVRSL